MARKQFMAEQIIIKLREAEVGLAFGAGGKFTRSQAQSSYPMEWTPYGSRSNREGGLVPGGKVRLQRIPGETQS